MKSRIIDVVIDNETGNTSINVINTGSLDSFGNHTGHIHTNISDASFVRLSKFIAAHGTKSHEFDYRPAFNRSAVVYKVH